MPRSQVIDPASVATHGHKGTTTSQLQRPVMARAEGPAGGTGRLDHDEVDTDRQGRQRRPARQPVLEEAPQGCPKVGSLAMVDRLLGQAEGPRATPPNLDDHEGPRRTRVHGDEIELAPADPHLATEDCPAGGLE